jgi:hypothetical protein
VGAKWTLKRGCWASRAFNDDIWDLSAELNAGRDDHLWRRRGCAAEAAHWPEFAES